MRSVVMDVLATAENFDDAAYVAANPDIAAALANGSLATARAHFESFGQQERRRLRAPGSFRSLREEKLSRIEPLLRSDMQRTDRNGKPDFLTDLLREATRISETDAVSSNGYDGHVDALISEFSNGLILDCGAGKRPVYYDNVVNYEIVDYDTTDVLGVGEALPFKDNSFEAVISIAVLEHVRDPFLCAKEIVRVLKPGGKLVCSVPFLQPEHGYPHHYYNMSRQGIKALFEDRLVVDRQHVEDSMLPIWTLTWFLTSWARGLDGAAKENFLDMRLRDFIDKPVLDMLEQPWVRGLPEKINFELACATMLFAHKV